MIWYLLVINNIQTHAYYVQFSWHLFNCSLTLGTEDAWEYIHIQPIAD